MSYEIIASAPSTRDDEDDARASVVVKVLVKRVDGDRCEPAGIRGGCLKVTVDTENADAKKYVSRHLKGAFRGWITSLKSTKSTPGVFKLSDRSAPRDAYVAAGVDDVIAELRLLGDVSETRATKPTLWGEFEDELVIELTVKITKAKRRKHDAVAPRDDRSTRGVDGWRESDAPSYVRRIRELTEKLRSLDDAALGNMIAKAKLVREKNIATGSEVLETSVKVANGEWLPVVVKRDASEMEFDVNSYFFHSFDFNSGFPFFAVPLRVDPRRKDELWIEHCGSFSLRRFFEQYTETNKSRDAAWYLAVMQYVVALRHLRSEGIVHGDLCEWNNVMYPEFREISGVEKESVYLDLAAKRVVYGGGGSGDLVELDRVIKIIDWETAKKTNSKLEFVKEYTDLTDLFMEEEKCMESFAQASGELILDEVYEFCKEKLLKRS